MAKFMNYNIIHNPIRRNLRLMRELGVPDSTLTRFGELVSRPIVDE